MGDALRQIFGEAKKRSALAIRNPILLHLMAEPTAAASFVRQQYITHTHTYEIQRKNMTFCALVISRGGDRTPHGNRMQRKNMTFCARVRVCFFLAAAAVLVLRPSASSAFSTTASSRRVSLTGIDASEFRHPLDKDLTAFVRAAPLSGVGERAIRRSLAIVEQGVRLDLLGSSIKVSKSQLPELYEAVQECSRILDLETTPKLYVQSNPQANAFTLALRDKGEGRRRSLW